MIRDKYYQPVSLGLMYIVFVEVDMLVEGKNKYISEVWRYIFSNDKESCEKIIRRGAKAAFLSATVTLLYLLAWICFSFGSPLLNNFLDAWIIIDVGLAAVLGVFVLQKSRIASTLLFIYFVASKICIANVTGRTGFDIVAIVFICIFFAAMVETFKWHRFYKKRAVLVE